MKTELKKSEQRIIEALTFTENQKLRWGDLVKKTGLSKRALSQSLSTLVKQQRIRRLVDSETDEYPPPVYYQLVNERERRFAEMVNKEWQGIWKRMNGLFKITFEEKAPERCFEEILKAILTGCMFTLHYVAEAPNMLESAWLLEWHLRIHREIMTKTLKDFSSSKRYRQVLKQVYEGWRDELMKTEVQQYEKKN